MLLITAFISCKEDLFKATAFDYYKYLAIDTPCLWI